jgi:hypothetical protein
MIGLNALLFYIFVQNLSYFISNMTDLIGFSINSIYYKNKTSKLIYVSKT